MEGEDRVIVAIHQPQYLPWLGYFDKMDRADAFCYLDNVQFKKNEWQNRNRIRTAEGWQWLTVPVIHRFPQSIDSVEIDNRKPWAKKHLRALAVHYGGTPFFKAHMLFFEEIYGQNWQRLADLNIHIIDYLRNALGMGEKPALRSSALPLTNDDPTDRLVDICRHFGADAYLSGKDGAQYMDMSAFQQNGLEVMFQAYQHPVYRQRYAGFESHLSVLDLLFNHGPDSMAIIRSQGDQVDGR